MLVSMINLILQDQFVILLHEKAIKQLMIFELCILNRLNNLSTKNS